MQKGTEVEFKTLLTQQEYERLMEKFHGNRIDHQTNHYFETSRFSLKAIDASLRVRERDTLELTLKRKKGYTIQETSITITPDELEEIRKTGVIPNPEFNAEITALIGEQSLHNILSLSTIRMFFTYKNGVLFIDKSEYLGISDYELEYEAKSFHAGKQEFIEILRELNITYKRSEKKVKRAFNAYKMLN